MGTVRFFFWLGVILAIVAMANCSRSQSIKIATVINKTTQDQQP